MVEMGAKIKRKTYRFDLKRKYQYVSSFRTKERPPIEKIKDALKAFTTPKKQEKKAEAAPAATPKGGFNFVVFGSFILIAIIILVLAFIYLASAPVPPGGFQPPPERPLIENSILEGQILTTGERGNPQHIAALLIDYDTHNLENYSMVITTYDTKLPSEVFILESPRFEATSYPDFIRVLRGNLAKRKIILNEITISQLETMPTGAVVIVPSGVVPKELLGFDSQLSIQKLAERGAVIVYIGQPFTKMYNGTLVVTTPQTTVSALPVRFDESTPLQSSEGLHLFQPLYRVSGTSGFSSELVYGSVSITKRGNGAFVFLPQTLDGGWRGDFASAADDVARIVFETPWAETNANPAHYNFTGLPSYNGTRYFFSQAFESPNATAKVDFIGYANSTNISVRETLYIQLEKQDENNLYINLAGRVVPTNITNQPVRMNAELSEPVAAQPSMSLVITDVNGTELQSFPQGNVDVQSDKSFDVQVFVDRGEYIVKLIDDQGKTYAQTYMKVVSPEIVYIGFEAQRKSAYNFDIKMDGNPFTLTQVNVKVDDGQYGTYSFTDMQRLRVDVGSFTGGENLPQGNHSFTFTSGGLTVNVPVAHTRPRTIFDEPFFWITVILTGGVVGIGLFFARQESVLFSLDIPDFPPVAKTKIPLTPDTILGIFPKVNETYRWKDTPLTVAEVKNGFKDIFYKGKPVYITDYNVEYLLAELEKRGTVKESLGYYGLVQWEKEHSLEYLALMRRVRDICVNNAIPFTSTGESKDADTVITVVGQQITVHFFEKGTNVRALLSKVLPTIGRGISIILFKNEFEKEKFQRMMNSSPSVGPLIVKMEADSSSLLFLTTDELEKMLLEFKSM